MNPRRYSLGERERAHLVVQLERISICILNFLYNSANGSEWLEPPSILYMSSGDVASGPRRRKRKAGPITSCYLANVVSSVGPKLAACNDAANSIAEL